MDEDTPAIVPLESNAPSEADAARELAGSPLEEMVLDVAKVMDLIAERLELETPHKSTAKRVRGARTAPRAFVLALIAAADRRPDFPGFKQFDRARARTVIQSDEPHRRLAERITMLLASVNYTIEARWAEVVSDAMTAFTIASIHAEDPKNAELAAEVENIRRHLGRKGKRKKKKKETKTDEPSE